MLSTTHRRSSLPEDEEEEEEEVGEESSVTSRGTEPPVSPVLAPCGMTTAPAATHARSTSTASRSDPGRATARAGPWPRRAPRRYGRWAASDGERTCAAPTMPRSVSVRGSVDADGSSAPVDDGHDVDDDGDVALMRTAAVSEESCRRWRWSSSWAWW